MASRGKTLTRAQAHPRIRIYFGQRYKIFAERTKVYTYMPDILDNFRFYSQKLAIWPVFGNRKERLRNFALIFRNFAAQFCRAILAEMSAAYAIFVLANEGIARTKTLSLPQKTRTRRHGQTT